MKKRNFFNCFIASIFSICFKFMNSPSWHTVIIWHQFNFYFLLDICIKSSIFFPIYIFFIHLYKLEQKWSTYKIFMKRNFLAKFHFFQYVRCCFVVNVCMYVWKMSAKKITIFKILIIFLTTCTRQLLSLLFLYNSFMKGKKNKCFVYTYNFFYLMKDKWYDYNEIKKN